MSFICRFLDIYISYILYTKVIYLSFFWTFLFPTFCTSVIYLSFLNIFISYILYIKVIYMSFLDISISYILYIKVIYFSSLNIFNSYILSTSHLSIVLKHFHFLHFVHQSDLSFVLDISISHIMYTKVIYLSI
jgi:hypothetical protein